MCAKCYHLAQLGLPGKQIPSHVECSGCYQEMPLGSAPLEGGVGTGWGRREARLYVVVKASANPVGSSGVKMSPPRCPALGHNSCTFLLPHPWVRVSLGEAGTGARRLSVAETLPDAGDSPTCRWDESCLQERFWGSGGGEGVASMPSCSLLSLIRSYLTARLS